MTATVSGLAKLDRQLRDLPGSIQRKYLRQAARRAGAVVIKDAKKNLRSRVRKRTGNLLKSFKQLPSSKWRTAGENRRKGIIGTRVGFSQGGSHAHLIEYGHRIVTHAGVDTGGRVVAYPFLRPAIDANRSKVRDEFRRKLAEGIAKELRK